MLSSSWPLAAIKKRLEPLAFLLILSLLAVVYSLPLVLPTYLPMMDLPVHAQAMSIMGNMDDPAFGFSKYFEIRQGMLPYRTVYAVGGWLTAFTSAETAARLVLFLISCALMGGTYLCLKAFGRTPWLVVFAFPFIYDVNATYGYLAFRASVGLGLVLLALSRRELDQPRVWRFLVIDLLAVVLFFTHAHGFIIAATVIFAMILCCSPSVYRGFRLVLAGLPGDGCALYWIIPSMGLESTYKYLKVIRLMELVPHRLLNFYKGGLDEVISILIFGCLIALGFILRREERPRSLRAALAQHFPLLACALVIAAYFAFPNKVLNDVQPIYGINYRFLLPLALLLIIAPVGRARYLMPALIMIGIYVSVWFGLLTTREYVRFGKRAQVFDEIIAKIPMDRRVLSPELCQHRERSSLYGAGPAALCELLPRAKGWHASGQRHFHGVRVLSAGAEGPRTASGPQPSRPPGPRAVWQVVRLRAGNRQQGRTRAPIPQRRLDPRRQPGAMATVRIPCIATIRRVRHSHGVDRAPIC